MKRIGGFLVITVLVLGAFASMPNVSALTEHVVNGVTLTKSEGTFQPTSGKVCGLDLCGSKSIPKLTTEQKAVIALSNPSNLALALALESPESSRIMSEYYAHKNIVIPVSFITNGTEVERPSFNNFNNPTFYNPDEIHTTLQRTIVDSDYEITLPKNYNTHENLDFYNPPPAKSSIVNNATGWTTPTQTYVLPDKYSTFANPDHPVTVVEEEVMLFTDEVVLVEPEVGWVIDSSIVGICGQGTTLIEGVCEVINSESVNIDWADYWDTKEDKEIILEDIVMTDGTDTVMVGDSVVIEDSVVVEVTESSEAETMEETNAETIEAETIEETIEEQMGPTGTTGSTGTTDDEPRTPGPTDTGLTVQELQELQEIQVQELQERTPGPTDDEPRTTGSTGDTSEEALEEAVSRIPQPLPDQ